jgi:hypothetical protein
MQQNDGKSKPRHRMVWRRRHPCGGFFVTKALTPASERNSGGCLGVHADDSLR